MEAALEADAALEEGLEEVLQAEAALDQVL